MDAQAVDMEVLSINPWYNRDRELAAQVSRSRTRNWPSFARPARPFAGFASLTLQAPDLRCRNWNTRSKSRA